MSISLNCKFETKDFKVFKKFILIIIINYLRINISKVYHLNNVCMILDST